MRYAYARVSTRRDQTLNLQHHALAEAGYDKLFEDDGVSGASMDRPGYIAMRKVVKPGDTIVVWRLDRFGRSLRDLVDHIYALRDQGINFVSLTENIDLGSAAGELVLGVLATVASFERSLLVERTRAGMEAARARGSLIGRPQALNGEQFEEALFLIEQGLSVPETAQHFGIGQSTLYRYLKELRLMNEHCMLTPA